MRAVIRERWLEFSEPLEGGCSCLYNDARGLTTIAFGNLVNSPGEAAALPMVRYDGSLASIAEKIAAWHTVHDDPTAAAKGWRYAARLSQLRLPRDGMAALALGKLESNDRVLLARLPDWESYPANAQMAMHSWAWADGPHGHFPRLFQAVTSRDFQLASVEIKLNEWTPEGIHNTGLVPRNVANALLMRNAMRVEAFHLDPELLVWDRLIGASDDDTQPELTNPASEPDVSTPADRPTMHVDPSTYLRPGEDDE